MLRPGGKPLPEGDEELLQSILVEHHACVRRASSQHALHLRALGDRAIDGEIDGDRSRRVASDEPHAGSLDGLELGASDVVVLTDHDAPYAAAVLAAAVRSPARFVGMMSSRRHLTRHLDSLRALGLSEDEIARVHAPVGLDLGGRSADEIALSIAAGIVADDHGRDGGWLDR